MGRRRMFFIIALRFPKNTSTSYFGLVFLVSASSTLFVVILKYTLVFFHESSGTFALSAAVSRSLFRTTWSSWCSFNVQLPRKIPLLVILVLLSLCPLLRHPSWLFQSTLWRYSTNSPVPSPSQRL